MRSRTHAPVDTNTGTIPLKSRENFKFYEPLILLRALNDEMRETSKYISPDETCDVKDPKQLLKGFANKLALVCDSQKGDYGATATAVWISDDGAGHIQYHFTSNQRSEVELQQMVTFVDTLLKRVCAIASPKQNRPTTKSLLFPILQFNRKRIDVYLDCLRSEAQRCLDECFDMDDENGLLGR